MSPAPTPALGHVSSAPTIPPLVGTPRAAGVGAAQDGALDVADLYAPAGVAPGTGGGAGGPTPAELGEKLRQAYFWMVNHAIISPHCDVELLDGPPPVYRLGDSRAELVLPTDQSYSSFVLMPLLTFAVRGRCLLVGGPGRGKTASALLMGVIAGYAPAQVRRAVQHGHPQLSVADLFGTPLPRGLVEAERLADVEVAWRSWLGMRVKVVDEYNRIPTRTQSALLTVLADGYVEVYDQVFETGDAAWYLTANDDLGGGTYQVVEALRDRIDVVVAALPFNHRFLGALVERGERRIRPEEAVPASIVFDEAEHAALAAAVRAVPLPPPVRRRLEHFAGQLELLERAGRQFEYRTKDTARLAGVDPHLLAAADTGRDRLGDVGAQTLNGLSVRSLQALVAYAKAMALFRGRAEVGVDDLRAVLPFVLHDKVVPDLSSPAFEGGREELRTDRTSWLRDLFDTSCAQYEAAGLDDHDPVGDVLAELEAGLDGVGEAEVLARQASIEQLLAAWQDGRKLHGHLYDDALALKHAHQRYTNYLAWLRWSES